MKQDPAAAAEQEERPDVGPETVAGMEVGMRCEVSPGARRGEVMVSCRFFRLAFFVSSFSFRFVSFVRSFVRSFAPCLPACLSGSPHRATTHPSIHLSIH